jgi:hypothetical protein
MLIQNIILLIAVCQRKMLSEINKCIFLIFVELLNFYLDFRLTFTSAKPANDPENCPIK